MALDHGDACIRRRFSPLPTVLYRGSGNSPESVKELGGFIPRDWEGGGEAITNATFGLRSHHIGENRTLYTSTMRDIVMGATFALQKNVHGWVYQIHPTPNMIDLNESGFEIRFKREEEFSALGGILYNQIQAWAELAGDEANLAKFNEKTLEGYAIEFMEKNGGPVGWDGKFPLSALKADAPAEPTTPKEREDKLCSNSPDDFRMIKAECCTQVAQCVFEESGKANFDWSFITACMDIKWRIV
ncbi:Heat-labile A chain [Cordyceps militaris]|uniref:Heat-labile A chain n=1 Tax=Cordyceps militaris TaxID=73501 RepID=A0A2H4S8B2_CORMI|nr:Heat-labile A chain [Cordyceps militaris]